MWRRRRVHHRDQVERLRKAAPRIWPGVPRRSTEWLKETYVPAVLLRTPICNPDRLAPFVEEAVRRHVKVIAAVGPDPHSVEYDIDMLLIGDQDDPDCKVATTSHLTTIDALSLIEAMTINSRFAEVWF